MTGPGQRELDLELMGDVLRVGDLDEGAREAFVMMRDRLEAEPRRFTGGQRCLSDSQRAWLRREAEKHGVSIRPSNEAVPAGAPVATPAVLLTLPKAPPGRARRA